MEPAERAKEVCKRLSELEGKEIALTQQVTSGRIEIEGIFARFVDWPAAVQHLEEMLNATELHYAGQRTVRKRGWDKPKRPRKS